MWRLSAAAKKKLARSSAAAKKALKSVPAPQTPRARPHTSKASVSTPEKSANLIPKGRHVSARSFGAEVRSSRYTSLEAKAACSIVAGLHQRLHKKTNLQRQKRPTGKLRSLALDIAFLKKRCDDMIPKRPVSAYFLFFADDFQRKKVKQGPKEAQATEEAHMNSRLADVWKCLPSEEKAPYCQQHTQDRDDFEKKLQVWQQTQEFKQIDFLESWQKEVDRADKRLKKDSEHMEIQQLLDGGMQAQPSRGLLPGRTALITGLEHQVDLNAKEVKLVTFFESVGRWGVQLVDNRGAAPLNIRPVNLIWTALIKEVQRNEQQQKEETLKRQHREVKAEQRETEREIQRAAKAQERENDRSIWQSQVQAVKDSHKELRDAAKEQKRSAELAVQEAAKEARRAYSEALKEAAEVAERAFSATFKKQQVALKTTAAEMADAECLD